ncbi:DUF7146 domain-containing protein [Brevundimonas bacteroides]|uniref:DUF7146 domain-containing protein n=1 Tax=Brevundimonas bacteroides TaxID=74311 RepID=UPI000AA7C58F
MSLRAIVAALGGDLYHGGERANVPAPGHGPADRSVSLLLSEGRVVIHSFGSATWQAVRDDLQRRQLIGQDGRVTSGASSTPRLEGPGRIAIARSLWAEGLRPSPSSVVVRHLARRGLVLPSTTENLLEHPRAPYSAYARGGRSGCAMMAGIRDPAGAITAIELTYLSSNGQKMTGLRVSRKTVGRVPPGSAVRLRPASSRMLVAEGVVTTLSAMARFGLPGWALMSAGNLSQWTPSANVTQVLIAGD